MGEGKKKRWPQEQNELENGADARVDNKYRSDLRYPVLVSPVNTFFRNNNRS